MLFPPYPKYVLVYKTPCSEPATCVSASFANDIAKRTGCSVIPVEFDIRVLVDEYFHFRGYVEPDTTQTIFFLFLKIGELTANFFHELLEEI